MSFEWSEVEVGQVCNITSSKRIFAHEYVERGVPFYGSKEIIDKALGTYSDTTIFISDARFAEIAAKFGYPEEGDLLLSSVGNRVGIPYVIKDEGKFYFKDGNLTWFKEFNGLNSYFLCHWMKSAIGQSSLHAIMIGSAQKALTITGLLKLRICLPSIQQQEHIVAILNALDDRITLLRETNATLEAIAQALFKSWFVDFDPVHAKAQGRTPEGMDVATAALFPDGFEESELGLVPRGWRASIMGEVSTVGIGKTPPRKESQWFSVSAEDVRWVSIRDMGVFGVYASQTSEYLTSESIQRFNVRVVPDNTTLLSFKMTIGRVAITDGEMTTNEAIAHFKLDQQSPLTSEFAYLHLKQFNYASLSSTSSIADAVNSKTVRNIPVLVPNSEVLGVFQNQAQPLFDRIKFIEQQAQTLATLRDTLLPRLISGQLRLPETS